MVKNLTASAGDTGSIPGLGGTHMRWGNKACARRLLSPSTLAVLCNKRSYCTRSPSTTTKSALLTATRESPHRNKDPAEPKLNKYNFLKRNRITIWNSNFTSRYIPQNIESRDSRKYLYTHVHSSTIHSSQEVDATPESINGCVEKHSVVNTYNGMVFSLKTQRKTWYSLQHGWTLKTLSEIGQTQKHQYCITLSKCGT